MTKPRALLLDEVTSALDPELVGEVLEIIRELKGDGMTMLIATHEMGFARDFADEVCFLEAGRIVERGAPEQIFGEPAEAATRRFLARLLAEGARDARAGRPRRAGRRRRARSPAPRGARASAAARRTRRATSALGRASGELRARAHRRGVRDAPRSGRSTAARAKLGLGAVPAARRSSSRLAPARQWLILANLDRRRLLAAADRGSQRRRSMRSRGRARRPRADPDPWPLLESLHGQSQIGFASNWAGGQPNALVAYYGWMYDDGYGSGNIDCRTPTAPGCWGHRQNILAFATRTEPDAWARRRSAAAASYALTIVETSTAAWPYSYTWAAALRTAPGSGGPQTARPGGRTRA